MSAAIRTTCPYCGVGCGVLARTVGSAIELCADPDHPANTGLLCSKGHALSETLDLEGRLLHPQVSGRAVSWEEALDVASAALARIVREHGADAIAFYVSGQLLTEDYYVANKLMKGFIGSANIDTNSRLCMASAVAGYKRAFGEDLMPMCYEDLQLADLLVLAGSNAAWCHPVLFQRIVQEKQRRPGLRVVVIDPRRTATCDLADLHLPIRAGMDVWLFNGLLAHLHATGAVDSGFVHAHTRDLHSALAAAASCADPVQIASACGLRIADVMAFYELFAATPRVVTAFSQGINQSSAGTDKVNSIINCHLLSGRIGRPGAGPFSLTGQPNAMGGREVGGMANMLAAHLELHDPAHRQLVQEFWQSPRIAQGAGLKAVELFDAIHAGAVRAVWIMGTNPVVSLPDADRVREALQRCECVVVSDCMASTDTTALAHVLLPAAAWGEKNGSVTNSDRRISRQRAFRAPPGEARPDWWIVCEIARRMGFAHAFAYESPREIFAEHARLSGTANAGQRAFDISALAALDHSGYEAFEPIQWPVSASAPGGTARLFTDARFMHPDGRARFVPTPPRAPANPVSDAFPFVLNTGRIRDQWHTMTRTGRSPRLAETQPEPFLDLHPQDALANAVREGELARLTTKWGSAVLRVRMSGGMARGCAFAPMHWSDRFASQARVGALVNPICDALSGEPEFKHTPARIEPFPVDWYALVLSREPIEPPAATWWAQVQGVGCRRYELAGRGRPATRTGWARTIAGADWDGADYLEYEDPACGVYRGILLRSDRLSCCVYVSARTDLPERQWLAGLFARETLEPADRMALLAGRPLLVTEPSGPIVCACFRVGSADILRAIAEHGLLDAHQVGQKLRAGTNCGSCMPEINALLGESRLRRLPPPHARMGRPASASECGP